ncbi:MAG: shikimate kinase / 3-dehydroquinate synthase [Solirubrobacterales bacterium]|nr:shikimate kinase / 3-dehydroquinate synthase [Solirubrobacterales bacterium]
MAPLVPGRALVFVGFMGVGKSTAARKAAGESGEAAVDLDELLERELGMPVAEYFDAHGEQEFRRREAERAVALLEGAEGGAIALGGGSILSEPVREALRRHLVVWLDLPVEDAWERVSNSRRSRPLGRDRDAFESIYAERRPLYEGIADAVVPGDREIVPRALPAVLALAEMPEGTRVIWTSTASGEYPIFVGPGLLGAGYWPLGGRRFCVTDSNVRPLYGDRVDALAATVEIEPGESHKTLAEAERVWRELAEAGMTREDHLVALGGGVVGDLTGFCAAGYQRGVPVVQVPTTLVGQVDSAIGGKTGVDLPEAKNYVGAYHQPAAVLSDTETLRTLPAPELAAGFVEVVKTALIDGGALWERVRGIERVDPAQLDDVVFACARVKAAVVAADERDSDRRMVLNLGHTVGHAIEAASGYERYRHGEAVGLGLLAALRLSSAEELRDEVSALLARNALPVTLDPSVATDDILTAMARDKKADSEGVRFVLLERPGEPRWGERVAPQAVRDAVEELRG